VLIVGLIGRLSRVVVCDAVDMACFL